MIQLKNADAMSKHPPASIRTPGTPLTDTLGRALTDLRLSVIDQCSMRCPYCMPQEVFGPGYRFLPERDLLSFDEIERLVRVFTGIGVRKVKITGGEPLMRPLLPELIQRLSRIDGLDDVALITNGLLLGRMALPLKRAGLVRVTVSLDALNPTTFGQLSGRGRRVEQVLAGLEAAQRAGLAPIKINCVVLRGVNDREVLGLVSLARRTGHIVRFIEYMDVGGTHNWSSSQVVSSQELHDLIHSKHPLRPIAPSSPGEVARRYMLADGTAEIGFISSVTEPFCRSCARARLSADGRLFTCLFAPVGHDLRGLLRAGADEHQLGEKIREIWGLRADRYSEARASLTTGSRDTRAKVQMHYVGG
jgi:cyclic pyranopterin phosphate synthase